LPRAIDDQARSLLGADLVVESSRPFTAEQEQMLRSLGETQAREVRFRTMALFPKSGGTRLVHVRALGGSFPFYGKMETAPPAAAHTFREAEKRFRKKVFSFNSERSRATRSRSARPLSLLPVR
jgi:putative ABC transport system permease protein